MSPTDCYVDANGLRLHLVEWGEGDRVVLLLHGFLEHARMWDWVAPRLAAAGYRAVALDWRGHGDSFPEAAAWHLAEHGTRPDAGGRLWKFDPLHQTTSPQPYYVAQAREFWRRVSCPLLYVEGAESNLRLDGPDLADRLAILRARLVTVADAGHHPHVERPEAFAETVITFLGEAR